MAISAKAGPVSTRIFTGVLALLFLFAGAGDAWGAHHCPHHDGPRAAPTGAATDHGHGAPPHGEDHGPCTCVGRCHAGAAPSLGDPAEPAPLPVPPSPPFSSPAPEPPPRVALVPFAIPWSNAPPTL
ncbi:MAG TPA: hypothetical protein VIE68_04785 [Gemmatimonadota bacterium]|jgi:hypothetical protein